MYKQTLGTNLGSRGSKLGFWVKTVDSRKGKHQEQGYCSGASRHGDIWCARRDFQQQHTLYLLFRAFGGRSELSKMLLSKCLINVFTF